MSSVSPKWLLGSLWLCAGSAHALIDNGTYGTPGELFISIHDQATRQSYYRDLGIDLVTFLNNPVLRLDLASDQSFESFKGKPDLIYNVGANYPLREDLSNLESWGYLATSTGGDGIFDSGFNAVDTSKQIFEAYIGLLNPRPFTGNARDVAENLSGLFKPGDSAYFEEGSWGEQMGGLAGGNTTGKPGEPLPFFHVNNQTGEETGAINRLGYWLLNADGSLVFTAGSGNLPPVAQAGNDRVAAQGSMVPLTGFLSSDPDNGPQSLTYRWDQIDGKPVVLAGADTVSASFRADAPGIFTFRLTVSDGTASAEDRITVTVSDASSNQPPVARAGDDRSVIAGSQVTLDGRNSLDPDNAPLPLSYDWSQIAGTPVKLSDSSLPAPVFTASEPGAYVFQLSISDGIVNSVDAVTITVLDAANNQPPVVDAGSSQQAFLSTPVTLDGSASRDPDEGPAALTYTWRQLRGAPIVLEGLNTAKPRFTPVREGTYLFELTASDGIATAQDTVGVTVVKPMPNETPIAHAGDDQTVLLGLTKSVQLNGSASQDPDARPQALSAAWEQVSGPTVKMKAVNTIKPSFNLPRPGLYVFRLTVSDGEARSSDTVTLHAEPGKALVPVQASAGADQTVPLARSTVLDGHATRGSGPVNYLWSQLEGPVAVAIEDRQTVQARITLPKPGLYRFQLTASNAVGRSEDTVEVIAQPGGAAVTLTAPALWLYGQSQSLTWHLQGIPAEAEARILFSRDGKPFDLIARVSAGNRQLQWKPGSSQETAQGTLRICVKPASRKPQYCDSVGVVIQRPSLPSNP